MSYNWQLFKCRCSAITQMLSNSQGFAPLTELQVKELADLDKKEVRTQKQNERITELVMKREKSKEVVLSDTCIGYLMEHYAWVTEKMVSVSKEMDILQMEKGKMVEAESITLLSIVDGVIYEKNIERIFNDYLSGEPDIFLGAGIYKAVKIVDAKNSWDYPIFLRNINNQADPANIKQIQGYMDITGATEGEIAHTLISMPEIIVNDYRRKLFYKMNPVTDQSPEYLEACAIMEHSMNFDHIPHHKRVFKKKVEPFSEFDKQKVYDKVKMCRDWLFEFDKMYQKLNK